MLLVLYSLELARRRAGRRQIERLAAALAAAELAARRREFRLDRFELIWYPNVTVSADGSRVEGVAPGLPHCRKCLLPLKIEGEEWVCGGCHARHPGSLADQMATESIRREAVKLWEERRKSVTAP